MSLKGAAAMAGAMLDVRGDGAALPTDLFPIATPVTAQVVNFATCTCWESRFEIADVLRNANGVFRAGASSN